MSDFESPNPLNSTDFQKFATGDVDWFLGPIGNSIRTYCNWHIFPSRSDTARCRVWPDGRILLPTLKLTSLDAAVDQNGNPLDTTGFQVFEAGWIQGDNMRYYHGGSSSALPYQSRTVGTYYDITFTHGYDTLPPVVVEVGYEIALRAIEKPAGVVKSLGIGPTSYQFGKLGAYLDSEQRSRLTPYALQGIS